MGSLRKRGKVYHADVHVRGERKRFSLGTSNYGVAKAKLRQIEQKIEKYGVDFETRTPMTEVLPRFVQYVRARSTSKGGQGDVYRLKSVFGPVCKELVLNPRRKNDADGQDRRTSRSKRGRKPSRTNSGGKPTVLLDVKYVEEISSELVMDYLVRLQQQRGLSAKTINERREIIQRFCGWAIKFGGVRFPGEPRHNPVHDVDRFKVTQGTIRYLTIDQIHEQLDALADDHQMMVTVAVLIYAGLRREAALWLTPEDVDLELRVIHVREKTVNEEYWKPKTGVNRVVPISKALMQHLAGYRPPEGATWFFPSPQGCRWDPDNWSDRLRRMNAKADLPWTALDFRHSFGSHLAMKGESLFKISKLMGNGLEVCRKHYAHLSQESLKSLTATVDCDDDAPKGPTGSSDAIPVTTPHFRLVV